MQDFREHLDEQLDFLRSSMASYDEGKEHEAKRLALSIRVLVHSTRNSTSLLTHLGARDTLPWIDRGPPVPRPEDIVLSFGVCVLRFRFDLNESRYERALLACPPDRLHPPVSFEDWWRRPVLHDQSGREFSRSDIVLAMADQDGGAHIDREIADWYRELTRENSVGFTQDGNRPIANSLVHESIRQIAEELFLTVEKGLAWDDDGCSVSEPVCPLPLDNEITKGLSRNDACPCENGKKLKRCFGLREPLKRMFKAPADSTAGQSHPMPGAQPTADPDAPPSIVIDGLVLEPVPDKA